MRHEWRVVKVRGKGWSGEPEDELPGVLASLESEGWEIFAITYVPVAMFSLEIGNSGYHVVYRKAVRQ